MQGPIMIPDFITNIFEEVFPEEQAEIFKSRIPVDEQNYYFGRYEPSQKILVVREDGYVPFYEEVKPIVERVLQFENLKGSNNNLYALLNGETEMFQNLLDILDEIYGYYAEHMDLFPKEEFQRVKQTAQALLVQQKDLERANEELNQLSSNMFRNHDITPANLMKLKALHLSVAQQFQKQILTYNKTIHDEKSIVDYLNRNTPIWKMNWRRVLRDLKALQKQLSVGLCKELLEDSQVTGLFSRGVALTHEEIEMALEKVINQKTEIVMELMEEIKNNLNQV